MVDFCYCVRSVYVFGLQSKTMKIVIFVMCICHLLPVKPVDTDRYSYCESCLTAAREMDKAMKEVPAGRRHTVLEKLLRGQLCDKLLTYNHPHVPKEKMKSSCKHLFDSHHDQFLAALVNEEPKNLEIALCYEQSHACVGVRRQAFEDSKATFTETDIDALLRDNKENVRIAQPITAGSSAHKKDEL
ncbi:uncharacterized protein PAE49_023708 [Odontesthes bonariensis]